MTSFCFFQVSELRNLKTQGKTIKSNLLKPHMSKSKTYFEILLKKAFRRHLETQENQFGSIFKLNFKQKCQIPKKNCCSNSLEMSLKLSPKVFMKFTIGLSTIVLKLGSSHVQCIIVRLINCCSLMYHSKLDSFRRFSATVLSQTHRTGSSVASQPGGS